MQFFFFCAIKLQKEHTYTHTRTHTHTQAHTHTYIHARTHTHTYTHAHTHTHIHTRTHAHTLTHNERERAQRKLGRAVYRYTDQICSKRVCIFQM